MNARTGRDIAVVTILALFTALPGHSEPAAASAAQTAPHVYTLSEAITLALGTATEVRNARRAVEADKLEADRQAAAARPGLTASASATRFDAPTTIAFNPASPPITVVKEHTETLSLNLTDRLDLTGQVRAAVNGANLQTRADMSALDQASQARILQITRAYYAFLRAQHQVDVAEASLASAKEDQSLTQKQYDAGVGQKIDVFRATTRVAQAEQDIVRSRNNLSVAQAAFNNLIGVGLTTPTAVIDPAQGLFPLEPPGPPDGADSQSNSGTITQWQTDAAAINLESSIAAGLARRPEIQIAEANVEIARNAEKLAHAGLEPVFAVTLGGNYYPTTSFQTPRQRVGALTASVTVPILDGGATNDKVKEAQLHTQSASDLLASRKSDVTLQVQQAYFDLSSAARQLSAAVVALSQARTARQLAQVRYEGQVGLHLEVTDAQAALAQAEANLVDSAYDYLTARAVFENATGVTGK